MPGRAGTKAQINGAGGGDRQLEPKRMRPTVEPGKQNSELKNRKATPGRRGNSWGRGKLKPTQGPWRSCLGPGSKPGAREEGPAAAGDPWTQGRRAWGGVVRKTWFKTLLCPSHPVGGGEPQLGLDFLQGNKGIKMTASLGSVRSAPG